MKKNNVLIFIYTYFDNSIYILMHGGLDSGLF